MHCELKTSALAFAQLLHEFLLHDCHRQGNLKEGRHRTTFSKKPGISILGGSQ